MPTPPKPVILLKNEKKSHRTKSELKQREESEKAVLTGYPLKERKEVKNNKIADKEFKRLETLLTTMGKNDAIYEISINRYCLMIAECSDMEKKRENIYQQAQRLEQILDKLGANASFNEFRAVTNDIACIYGAMIAIDKQIQTKRKMLLDIEKENIMTIAAALRNIPKKQNEKEDPLLEALK